MSKQAMDEPGIEIQLSRLRVSTRKLEIFLPVVQLEWPWLEFYVAFLQVYSFGIQICTSVIWYKNVIWTRSS